MAMRTLSLDAFNQGVLRTLPRRLEAAVSRGLNRSAHRLAGIVREEIRSAQPHPAVDTGALLSSVLVTGSPISVVVAAPHAAYIDLGTRPHFPPVAPLAAWAMRRGLAGTPEEAQRIGFAIAKKIARDGIAPRHFMQKAWARFGPVVKDEVSRALAEEASRMGR